MAWKGSRGEKGTPRMSQARGIMASRGWEWRGGKVGPRWGARRFLVSPRTPQPDVSLAGVRELCSTAVSLWATGPGCDVSLSGAWLPHWLDLPQFVTCAGLMLPCPMLFRLQVSGWLGSCPKCLGTLVGYSQRLLAGSLS